MINRKPNRDRLSRSFPRQSRVASATGSLGTQSRTRARRKELEAGKRTWDAVFEKIKVIEGVLFVDDNLSASVIQTELHRFLLEFSNRTELGQALTLRNWTFPTQVNLARLKIPLALTFDSCNFYAGCSVEHLQLSFGLAFTRCTFSAAAPYRSIEGISTALNARYFTGSGFELEDVDMDGAINLTNAHIFGSVLIRGGSLTGSGAGVCGDRLKVDGRLIISCSEGRRFVSAGPVSLIDAMIGGLLSLSGSHLGANASGSLASRRPSLVCQGATIGGNVAAAPMVVAGGRPLPFTAEGLVSFDRAVVRGQMQFHGADLRGTSASLTCVGLEVRGRVFLVAHKASVESFSTPIQFGDPHSKAIEIANQELQTPFKAAGSVQLDRTHLLAGVEIRGAIINGALSAVGSTIEGFVDTSPRAFGISTVSSFSLRAANISGSVELSGLDFLSVRDSPGIDCSQAKVGGDLNLQPDGTDRSLAGVKSDFTGLEVTGIFRVSWNSSAKNPGLIDLTGATASRLALNLGILSSERKCNPDRCAAYGRALISLQNCKYDSAVASRKEDYRQFVHLLDFHSPGFEPSSYTQLAETFRQTGSDAAAIDVLVAQQDHRSRIAPQYEAIWLRLKKLTTRYGFVPARAVLSLALVIGLAALLVLVGSSTSDGSSGSPVVRKIIPATSVSPASSAPCSTGELFGLTLRTALPVVSGINTPQCVFNPSSTSGSAFSIVATILQIFAWLFGLLFVAAVTGIIRRP